MTPYYEQDGIVIYHGDCRRACWIWKPALRIQPASSPTEPTSHAAIA